MLIPCFAPGVDQAEGKALRPSEQTRNASLRYRQHEKLNHQLFVFLEPNTEPLKITCSSRCTQVAKRFKIITKTPPPHPNTALSRQRTQCLKLSLQAKTGTSSLLHPSSQDTILPIPMTTPVSLAHLLPASRPGLAM